MVDPLKLTLSFFLVFLEAPLVVVCGGFPFGKEKLIAPLIAIPNVDKAHGRQKKGKKLN